MEINGLIKAAGSVLVGFVQIVFRCNEKEKGSIEDHRSVKSWEGKRSTKEGR